MITALKKNISGIFIGSLVLMTGACTYNNEEDLYPIDTCDTVNVTYSATIAPIIMQNCFDCHGGGNVQISGISLEGYSNLKTIVEANRLVGAIRHEPGFSFMPKDRPSLPECEILKIEKWVSAGAPDN